MTPRPQAGNLTRSTRRAPRCRGGASSLLRLSQPAQSRLPRLPSTGQLSGWIERVGRVLAPEGVFVVSGAR